MSYKKNILLIEDHEETAALVKLQGELSGFKVFVEVDGLNGFRAIERERPDLVILDVMLPGLNGYDVCRRVKNHPSLKKIPVIFLSAKNEEIDVVLGLELGADDFISKPFSPKILFSKIKAILRRSRDFIEKSPKKEIAFEDCVLDVDRYLLKKQDKIISLTLSEFGILRRLLMQRGQVLSRSQLLDDVDKDDALIVERNIDVHIAALRKKLGPNFKCIETVRGIGYRFKELKNN